MKYNIFFFIALVLVLLPATTHAGDFVNLVGVPGLTGNVNAEGGLNSYINALYRLSISIAALLAVIKIVIAGAKYMLSDIITHKEEAKKDIQGALIGLLIVIGAIIILNTINTDLTNLNLTIDTATVSQDPMTIQEYIAERQQALEDSVADDQAELVEITCPYYTVVGLGDSARCSRECREMQGQYNNDIWDSCTVSTSLAATCDPDTNVMCCDDVNGADWDEGEDQTGTCSGVAQGLAERAQECGEAGRVWDAAGRYCRTATCNINTDVNCCSVANGTIVNGVCQTAGATITDEQVCINRGAGWAFQNGLCVQQTSGNDTQPLPTPRPADPYTHCFRIEPQGTWEFNESANYCQRIPTN